MTTQFEGETNWDAIVNDNSLDIVEEQEFVEYIHSKGLSEDSLSLAELEQLFDEWKVNLQ